MTSPSGARIDALDLIRGVAMLGILAVNMEGFAGPIAATITPDWNGAVSGSDHFAFAATLVLFEGKMRALLSLLFGASMLLFVESAESAGRNGDRLQMRRLGWLAVIGYLHFALLWWGDILFTYAFCGFFALLLRHLPVRAMIPVALLAFALWHGSGTAASVEPVLAEMRMASNSSPPPESARLSLQSAENSQDARTEAAREQGSYPALVRHRLTKESDLPMTVALNTIGETLPFMLIGMGLFRGGFFTGAWTRRQLKVTALTGVGLGGLLTLGLTAICWSQDFRPELMKAMLGWWLATPHLAMAIGYAALLVLVAQRAGNGWLGRRIRAVGRMALSNYLGCTLVMTALFYGWGFGLQGSVPERWYWPFVLAGWLTMLWASPWWLARFRQGPVEWAWRSLTQWQRLPFRRGV